MTKTQISVIISVALNKTKNIAYINSISEEIRELSFVRVNSENNRNDKDEHFPLLPLRETEYIENKELPLKNGGWKSIWHVLPV